VAVTGAALDACLTSCVTGMRSLHFPEFNLCRGFSPLPPSVQWQYTVGSLRDPRAIDVYYYSGWASVHIRVVDGQDTWDVPLESWGPGRTRHETVWHVRLPTEQFTRQWGFLPLGPQGELDRPPEETLYRPLASHVYLADGEFFYAPPPAHRSAP